MGKYIQVKNIQWEIYKTNIVIWRIILPTREGTIYVLYNLTTRCDVSGSIQGYGLLLLMTHWYPIICMSTGVYPKEHGKLMVAAWDSLFIEYLLLELTLYYHRVLLIIDH